MAPFSSTFVPDDGDVVDWGQFTGIQAFIERAAAARSSVHLGVWGKDGCTFAICHALASMQGVRRIKLSARGTASTPRSALAYLLNALVGQKVASSRTPPDDVIDALRTYLNDDALPHIVVAVLDAHEWTRRDAEHLQSFPGLDGTRTPLTWILDQGVGSSLHGSPDSWRPFTLRLPDPSPNAFRDVLRGRCRAAGLDLDDESLDRLPGTRLADQVAALGQRALEHALRAPEAARLAGLQPLARQADPGRSHE